MHCDTKGLIYFFTVVFLYMLGFITIWHGANISKNEWMVYLGVIFVSAAAALLVAFIVMYTISVNRDYVKDDTPKIK